MARKKPLKSDYRTLNISLGDCFKGGGFGISSPTSWYYNGSNYYLYFERYTATNPSRMWIIKQTDNNIETNFVNTGTLNPDNLDHTTPIFGGVKDGYIYVMQCDGWVQPIRVYKSPNPETITGTWTYVGDFDTDASYIWTIENSNINDCWYVTRSGNSGNNGYDMSLLNVDLDDPTNYTKLRVTEGNFTVNQVRHYALCAYFTGTSTYRALFVNHRNESTSITYKVSVILWEVGTNNMHDLALTTSKDVDTNGGLDTTELENDFALIGTDSSKAVWNVVLSSCQISNDIFIVTSEPTGTYIKKYSPGSSTPTATYTLPWWPYFSVKDTGTNLLLEGRSNSNDMRIYSIEYDLTGFTAKKTITGLIPSGNDWGMPYNYGDIEGKYMVLGDAETDGNVPVILTKEMFD